MVFARQVVYARQAWIQADQNRYNGAHEEVLWTAFAHLGLGVGAANYTDSATLPSHFKPVVHLRPHPRNPFQGGSTLSPPEKQLQWQSVVTVKVNPQTVVTLYGVRVFLTSVLNSCG